jgi:prepilin signal peptidase PulO-like enzyme (type II secretory pathway)
MKKKNNRLSNEIFDMGVQICLAPINYLLRALPYQVGVATSIVAIFVWCMPIMVSFSIVSNVIFVLEIGIKLVRK